MGKGVGCHKDLVGVVRGGVEKSRAEGYKNISSSAVRIVLLDGVGNTRY